MIKVNKQKVYHLPYVFFISKMLRHYYMNLIDEVTLGCSKMNQIWKPTQHHMGLRKNKNGWVFKDEHIYLWLTRLNLLGLINLNTASSQRRNLSSLWSWQGVCHHLEINAFGGTSKDDETDKEIQGEE
ncbi:hypothetical protein LR48_Vigan530s000200 [Vigna angularis]|uniref:Uncharacterized protein n=1 Tax=Phaseolus angularis TaxID=3914 RepID=A0A0L9TCK7_PHAAN|nr:hypothetical protein LR48_Vigan530s000200 [Vigna angularis]